MQHFSSAPSSKPSRIVADATVAPPRTSPPMTMDAFVREVLMADASTGGDRQRPEIVTTFVDFCSSVVPHLLSGSSPSEKEFQEIKSRSVKVLFTLPRLNRSRGPNSRLRLPLEMQQMTSRKPEDQPAILLNNAFGVHLITLMSALEQLAPDVHTALGKEPTTGVRTLRNVQGEPASLSA